MGNNLFKAILKSLAHRLTSKIRYLIIDFDNNTGTATFLYYGGRAFFKKTLFEAVINEKLISGLHPEQACFMGIIFSRWFKEKKTSCDPEKYQEILRRHNYHSTVEDDIAFDRKGNLIYMDKKTGQVVSEKAHIIASNRELISQFNPLVACSIGIFVGNNLRRLQDFENPEQKHISERNSNVVPFTKSKINTKDG